MPDQPVLDILVNFSFDDGANPYAGLIADENGNLFGTTRNGGSDSSGTVFELVNGGTVTNPNYSAGATPLYSFTGVGSDGGNPYAGLIADGNGNLFGTTFNGGSDDYGTVFELVNHGSTTKPDYSAGATTLYSFTGEGSDGSSPYAGLIADGNGDLFGTTFFGGSAGYGTVFEIVNNAKAGPPDYSSGATTLYNFTGVGSDGSNPYAGLIADGNGDLFGTSTSGGSDDYGTVFELVNHGSATKPDYGAGATTLYSFTGEGSDGSSPYAGLIADVNGDLFGTTFFGGSAGDGTVFEIVNNAKAGPPDYTAGAITLYSFTGTGTDGAHPRAGLIADANGDLFGTTVNGGSDGLGAVFEIVNQGTAAAPDYDAGATTLHSFAGYPGDGAYPAADLIADVNGNLLGTTSVGGSFSGGAVFEITDSGFAICFMAGTLVRTPAGEAAIETLKRGDLVLTADGRAVPVAWLGRQTVSTRFADPLRVLPIRIRASALGENVPCRDLLVSPCHALLIDEILIQAGALVNGVSILRETDVPDSFVYYHVELDNHALILAENTPAETFIDNVDRMVFDNWSEHEALYPEGKPVEEMPLPRAKARRQIPDHIRAAIDARLIARRAEEISAVA